ncbi:MAG TPA: ABC transporter permease [Terriglobales bacterium]|nr:ABC transporter permease [Terriglobales bacterium]
MKRILLFVRLAIRNVTRNRFRSAYAVATIAIGAMGLFIFMGFNRGLMNQYRANSIRARWANGQLCTRGYRAAAWPKPWEKWIASPDIVMRRVRLLSGVQDVFPRITVNAMLVVDDNAIVGQGDGIDGVAESRFFTQLNYIEGGDFKDLSDSIVLGQGLAQGLGIHVGDKLQLMTRDSNGDTSTADVRVTGIFHTGSQEFDSRSFRIPLAVAQRLIGTDRVETISVALSDVNAWAAFAQAARDLPELEAVPFDELDKVYYKHAVDWLDAQFGFIRGIILLVVFLAIFNVISIVVIERTLEIGTLRANGDSRLEIALGHGTEAALLGLMGGMLGVLTGWLLTMGPLARGIAMPPAPGITRSFRILIELGSRDAVQVLLLCILTAVAGCLLPVLRAVRIPIAEALRHA